MQKRHWLALLLALMMTLSGCSALRGLNEDSDVVTLPEPSPEPPVKLFGESRKTFYEMVSICTVSEDRLSLTASNRTLAFEQNEDRVARVLVPVLTALRQTFSLNGLRVLNTEQTGEIVTLHCSAELMAIENEQQRFAAVAAMSNTLLALDGVGGVNVLVCGRALSFRGLPLGMLTEEIPSVTPAFAQINVERDYFSKDSQEPIRRNALIYKTSENGECYAPTQMNVSFYDENYAARLLELCPDVPPLKQSPVVKTDAAGRSVLELVPDGAYNAGKDPRTGAVVLTATSFLPGLDGVRFGAGRLFERHDFVGRLGIEGALYLPDEQGRLVRTPTVMSLRAAKSPMVHMHLLLDALGALEPKLKGMNGHDMLGISLDNGVVTVNMSAGFYRASQSLTPKEEKAVVYAIVNTLCSLQTIDSVHILFDGHAVETLAGTIYLRGNLLPMASEEIRGENK